MRISKHQRQHRITRLLEAQAVSNQAQLVELLAGEGIEATQATVSRDLVDLGVVKVRLPGGESAYALPELPSQQIAPEEHLRRVLGEWVVEISSSQNLVVLRTPPGSAHVVGSALDRSGLEGVLGTVAGDDTLLVVAEEAAGGEQMAAALAELAGLQTGNGAAPLRLTDPWGGRGPSAPAGPGTAGPRTTRPRTTTTTTGSRAAGSGTSASRAAGSRASGSRRGGKR